MTAPAETETSSARAWAACTLVLLAAAWLVVGLLALDGDATGSLAIVVAPAVALVAGAAALVR